MRRLLLRAVLAVTAVAGLPTAGALAHHSMTIFEIFSTTIEGTVQEFKYVNPHSILVIKAPGPDGGTVVWHLEGDPPATLERAGFTPKTFHPGDRLKMEIHRLRNGQPGGFWNVRMVLTQNGHEFIGHQCLTWPDHCEDQ